MNQKKIKFNTASVQTKFLPVSVIIPFYNGSKYIERAIKSVISQSMPAAELIIVDDGSSKKEANFLEKLNDKYRFKIIRKNNGGQGSARNYGVDAANGEFVCFLDQDDYFLIDHIKILYNAINFSDKYFCCAYGDLKEADGDGNIIRNKIIKIHSTHPKFDVFTFIREDAFILPSASIIKKSAFIDIGGFDVQFTGYEDDDLFLRFFRAGYNLYYVDEPVTVWCINTESTSYSIKMSRSRYLYIKKLIAAFPDEKEKMRFYFRDVIFPRFYKLIWSDVARAVLKKDSSDIDELARIHNNFCSISLTKNISIKNKITLVRNIFFTIIIRAYINIFYG